MNIEFLINAIVHQTTILIAQLATRGGARAPLAQVANQVFLDLARELERQGVSRKVSADMFGLGLRTYRRKIQRLSESSTERGRSLWEVVLEYVSARPQTTKQEVLQRFAMDDEAQVRAVLRDLCESQLILAEGNNTYRAASDEELLALQTTPGMDGYDDLLVALMFREGPLTLARIAKLAQTEERVIEGPIQRLVEAGRIQRFSEKGEMHYEARALVIPLGADAGWEAAVFDHFKAMVRTILLRSNKQEAASLDDLVGGSTYTIDIWPDHPMAEEVMGTLKEMRSRLSELRERVTQYNASQVTPENHSRVVIYAGQSVVSEEGSE